MEQNKANFKKMLKINPKITNIKILFLNSETRYG